VLSAVSPAVARIQLHDLRASGTTVGRLSAWATTGALVGTFGTGFVLVPLMPVSTAVLATGALLVVAGIALGLLARAFTPAVAVGAAVAAVALGALSASLDSPCDVETDYHCASIVLDGSRPSTRALLLDDVRHSFVDLDDPAHLEYAYTKWIADGMNSVKRGDGPLDVVFVGGGGFTLPRWLTATRPGSEAHVLEVDGDLVEVARERLGLRTSDDLRVTVGDARISMLDRADDSADVIVGDAFGKLAVPWHLATLEWADEIRRVLKPDGLYVLNLIDLPPLELLSAEAATLRDRFAHVRVIAVPGADGKPIGGNLVLLASDRPLPAGAGSDADGAYTWTERELAEMAGDAEPLRDDLAPADQLLTSKPS
jgi:SAM-dependent methyltransferase